MSTLKTTNIQHPSAASPAVELTAAGGLWLGGGKVLQVVRDTDTTQRTTTSTSFVDITGVSVTITPNKSDSAVLLILTGYGYTSGSNIYMQVRITDNSGNAIDGGIMQTGGFSSGPLDSGFVVVGYSTPATTSATTYKAQFRTTAGTATLGNNFATMQLFAIEVSA